MNTHPLLANLARFGVRLGLDRMRGFLEHLGAPHRAAPVIHVAGTNGKGSVVRLVGAILRAQGLRVGEYTSPHLQHINERLVVYGLVFLLFPGMIVFAPFLNLRMSGEGES